MKILKTHFLKLSSIGQKIRKNDGFELGLILQNMLPLESNLLKPKIVHCLEKTVGHLKV